MPSSTEKQAKFMSAIAHGWKPSKGGPSKKVAEEFHEADKERGVHSCPKCGHYFAGGGVEKPEVPDYEREKTQRDLWNDMYGQHHDHGEGPIHFDEGGEVELSVEVPSGKGGSLAKQLVKMLSGRGLMLGKEQESEDEQSWRGEEGYKKHHRDELASDEPGRYARGGFAKRLASRSGFKPFKKK